MTAEPANGRIWAAGGRPVRVPVAGAQPGRGEALCVFQAYGTQASQIGDLAQKVGGVKALADALKVNRGTLQHIIDGHRPVPLKLWQSLTGVDQMTAALAGMERARRQHIGKNVAILRDRRGGKTVPMTLETFRIRLENGGTPMDSVWSCTCMGA